MQVIFPVAWDVLAAALWGLDTESLLGAELPRRANCSETGNSPEMCHYETNSNCCVLSRGYVLVNRKTGAETQFVSLIGTVTLISMCIPIPETEFTVSAVAESLVFTNLTMRWVTVLQQHGFGCVKGPSKAPNISLSRKLSFIVFKPCELWFGFFLWWLLLFFYLLEHISEMHWGDAGLDRKLR